MTASKLPVAGGLALLEAVDLAVVATDTDMVVTVLEHRRRQTLRLERRPRHATVGSRELLGTADSEVTSDGAGGGGTG